MCVWQLVNLMHAINYVVSLTDGARVSQAKIETEDIFAACQYDFSNIMCEFFFISFFVTRTAPRHIFFLSVSAHSTCMSVVCDDMLEIGVGTICANIIIATHAYRFGEQIIIWLLYIRHSCCRSLSLRSMRISIYLHADERTALSHIMIIISVNEEK